MSTGSAPTIEHGPAAAMLAMGRTLLSMLRTRGSLLGMELAEEHHRWIRLALHAALALICTCITLQLLAFVAVAWFWDTAYRLHVAGGLVLVFAAAAAACLHAMRRLRAHARPFEATLLALAGDLNALQ
ncbi:MAG: hypothetical protein NVS2B4_20850 [Ramlibacter sp.]